MSDGASQLSTHRADRAGSIRTLRTLRDTSPVSRIDGLFFLSSSRARPPGGGHASVRIGEPQRRDADHGRDEKPQPAGMSIGSGRAA